MLQHYGDTKLVRILFGAIFFSWLFFERSIIPSFILFLFLDTLQLTGQHSSIKHSRGSTVLLQAKQLEPVIEHASEFSLIIWEKEKEPFKNEWLALAVTKLPNKNTVIPDERFEVGGSSSLLLYNVTILDSTRYRCTFFSSVMLLESYVFLVVTGLCFLFLFLWKLYKSVYI